MDHADANHILLCRMKARDSVLEQNNSLRRLHVLGIAVSRFCWCKKNIERGAHRIPVLGIRTSISHSVTLIHYQSGHPPQLCFSTSNLPDLNPVDNTCGKYCNGVQNTHHWSGPIDDATDKWLPQWRHDPAWPTLFSVAISVRPDQWCVFCTPSLAIFPTRCIQLDSNLPNLEVG